jgi:pilus assembly protein Flp/PilA
MTGQVVSSAVRLLRRFRADESGATAIEYALIAAGVGGTIATTVYNMGTTLKTAWWDKVGNIF